jgi:hypothetical protein
MLGKVFVSGRGRVQKTEEFELTTRRCYRTEVGDENKDNEKDQCQ